METSDAWIASTVITGRPTSICRPTLLSIRHLSLAGWIPRNTAFVVNITIFGGLVAGRLVSLFLDGGIRKYGPLIRALFVIDALGFALSVVAFTLERSH